MSGRRINLYTQSIVPMLIRNGDIEIMYETPSPQPVIPSKSSRQKKKLRAIYICLQRKFEGCAEEYPIVFETLVFGVWSRYIPTWRKYVK